MKQSITNRLIPGLLLVTLIFFMIGAVGFIEAAETQVSISASNNLAFVGDKINLKIILKTTHTDVQEINVQTEKIEFEILDRQPTQKRQQTDYMVFEKNIIIAFFNTGNYEIGPFTIEVIKDDKIIESKKTNSVPVVVKSVLGEKDTDIKPLKGLIDLKGNPWYLLKYVFFGLAVIALLIFLILWIKKRRKAAPPPPMPLMSPLEELEARLKELAEKKFVESGKLKLYFIELTRLIKYFLHRNYVFNAEDYTTEETLYYLKNYETEASILDNWRFVFNTADLVKFAKFIPDLPVITEVNEKIKEIVTRYKLRISPPPQENNTINTEKTNTGEKTGNTTDGSST